MKLLRRKSRVQRLLDGVADAVDMTSRSRSSLPGTGSRVALPAGLDKDKVKQAGLIAGGVAGLTAGSAGISSLRRRAEGARDDS